jgi:hypothetical protein
MRANTLKTACCCCFLLLAACAAAQEQSAQPSPRVQAGIGFLGAGATGDFGVRVDAAAGILLHMDVQVAKSIFSVGGEWAGTSYGEESRDAYIGNVIPDMPDLTLKVDTSNGLWFLVARLRAQKKTGRWRPYADGLAGVMNISTTTAINGAMSCTGGGTYAPASCSADQAASVTNADATVPTFGAGGGVMIRLGQRAAVPRLDLSVRYQRGGDATYLTKGAIVREENRATFNFSRSPIDLVTVYVGFAVGR